MFFEFAFMYPCKFSLTKTVHYRDILIKDIVFSFEKKAVLSPNYE